MKFESALSTIREFGGRIKRVSFPEIDYFIDTKQNILMHHDYDEDLGINEKIDEAQLWGSDLLADDWEVDTDGTWKDQ